MHRLAVCLVVVAAVATPAAAQRSDAETLFNQGKLLMDARKFDEACTAFESSEKIDPAITTLVNLANCRELNEQFATAWELFNEVERQSRGKRDPGNRQLHKLAMARAEKLGPRISRLTLKVAATPGLEILRNEIRVAPELWNTGIPIDGGTYKITARVANHEPWSSEITIQAENDTRTVEVPTLREAARYTTVVKPRSKTLPFIFTASAVALGGGALGFELWARSVYDDAKVEPATRIRSRSGTPPTRGDTRRRSSASRRLDAPASRSTCSRAPARRRRWLFRRPPRTVPAYSSSVRGSYCSSAASTVR